MQKKCFFSKKVVNFQKNRKKVKKITFFQKNGKSQKKSHSKNRSPVNFSEKKVIFFTFFDIFKKNQKYAKKKHVSLFF